MGFDEFSDPYFAVEGLHCDVERGGQLSPDTAAHRAQGQGEVGGTGGALHVQEEAVACNNLG